MAAEATAQKQEWHDWVGELFEPAFGATIEDLLGQTEEPEHKPRVKHVSVHDPEAVRQVYEKVRLMAKLDEEMRQQRAAGPDRQEQASGPQLVDQTSSSVLQETQRDETKSQTLEKPDLNQSCIWDSEEIGVLREAFKSVKQQNVDAMVHSRLTTQRNKELEELVAKQQRIIEAQKEKMIKTRNANQRLKISVDSLKEEVRFLTAKCGAMEEVFGELTREKSDMVQELHDNRVTVDKERMARERIQLKLDCLKQEATAEKLTIEENVKNMCRKTILDLQQMVKKLEKELEEERNKRIATEKGLKHLRTHFSSLPMQDIVPPNIVEKDEVSRVQY